jgi:hypothetical protein
MKDPGTAQRERATMTEAAPMQTQATGSDDDLARCVAALKAWPDDGVGERGADDWGHWRPRADATVAAVRWPGGAAVLWIGAPSADEAHAAAARAGRLIVRRADAPDWEGDKLLLPVPDQLAAAAWAATHETDAVMPDMPPGAAFRVLLP